MFFEDQQCYTKSGVCHDPLDLLAQIVIQCLGCKLWGNVRTKSFNTDARELLRLRDASKLKTCIKILHKQTKLQEDGKLYLFGLS
jgi:hypothetical protein